MKGSTIALFPEASYGAALNCVGIAQALRREGAHPVFICHDGFRGVFAEYGFAEYPLPAEAGMPASEAVDWNSFVSRHRESFRRPAAEQIESYVVPTWEAIVSSAARAEAPLRALLARLKPAAVVLDNVVMFPAIRRSGLPWVRVISCAETELPDADVPPYLSGCAAGDRAGWAAFRTRYEAAVAPVHRRFNALMAEAGLDPYPDMEFLEPSPYLNLLLAPEILRHRRAAPLDPQRFVFLEGCVRSEGPYQPPVFAEQDGGPLVYVSFGSLGAVDTVLIERMIGVFATLPCRFLVAVGGFRDQYSLVPDNVFLDGWFPQPSVVAKSSLFIHHGGNNSVCEALYFGVPSLVMPYCWDGHDNARRMSETGTGRALPRYDWSDDDLRGAILGLLADTAMNARLRACSARMKAADGAGVAARAILDVLPVTAARR
ncbi:glycosyltransferase [Pseudoxanthobacter sp.]|uniref:glycosyltransferase n=1 Tax=Pseudoxanthobacter sp. TaxID=1925742 RepID=UPI002FE17191